MGTNQDKASCCGQPSRTGRFFTCLPNWVFGRTTANEKALLLTLQFHAPNIRPSLHTLARESGLSLRTVQRVLSELEAKGWVAKEETMTASGGKGANRYELSIWKQPEEQPDTCAESDPDWSQRPEAMATVARGVWTEWPGGMATVANKEEQSNKNNLLTKEEPPLPPASQGELRPPAVAARPCRDRDGFLIADPEPQPEAIAQPPVAAEPPSWSRVEVQPQPQQPNPPRPQPNPADPEAIAPVKPKARKREAGFTPTVEDVPAALLAVHRELLAFWPARNPKGKRTQRAWGAMLTDAQKIQDHQQGGTEILRQQLEQGAAASVTGAGWQGLSFANWLRYGDKATTPVMGTGFNRRQTPEESAAEAVAYIRARDARAAAAAANNAQPALLVGVAA